jgi:hypothetical protein
MSLAVALIKPLWLAIAQIRLRAPSVFGMAPLKPEDDAIELDTLDGKTVCLVWNYAFKADVTLPAIAEELKRLYPGIKIIPYTAMPLAPLPEAPGTPKRDSEALQAAYKAKGAQAVIAGNGG